MNSDREAWEMSSSSPQLSVAPTPRFMSAQRSALSSIHGGGASSNGDVKSNTPRIRLLIKSASIGNIRLGL